MLSRILKSRVAAAFTIAELMMASAVGSVVLGGLMVGSIALRRAFVASEHQAVAQADILRVADYVARDIRCATSVNATATSTVLLTVTTGDYYDRRGTPSTTDDVPNSPVLGRTGATYGASPVTIRYLKSGTRICREVTQTDAGGTTVTPTWIADNVDTLTFTRDAEGIVTIAAEFALRYSSRTGGAQAPKRNFTMVVHPRNPIP